MGRKEGRCGRGRGGKSEEQQAGVWALVGPAQVQE